MEINLISDTITKPTHEMLQYMFKAEVGMTYINSGPNGYKLQKWPLCSVWLSGTMANQQP
jgi:threonine aldolase